MRERGGVELEIWDQVSGFARSECFVGRTAGLIQPTVFLPAAMRASLIEAITEAKMGADADVPPDLEKFPFTATTVGHLE